MLSQPMGCRLRIATGGGHNLCIRTAQLTGICFLTLRDQYPMSGGVVNRFHIQLGAHLREIPDGAVLNKAQGATMSNGSSEFHRCQ
jgi:hypothetical protein